MSASQFSVYSFTKIELEPCSTKPYNSRCVHHVTTTNSNMHGCWRSINLNAFNRILVNKRTIHYDVTTQNFFIRRPSQSRHSSPNLPFLPIYQYVRFLAKTDLDSRFPKECVYAVRVGRSAKEFVVSNLVTSSPLNHRTTNFYSTLILKVPHAAPIKP